MNSTEARRDHCSVEGCERPIRCKALCNRHYFRMRRQGSPHRFTGTIRFHDPAVALEKRTTRSGDCLLWGGKRDTHGYGVISIDDKIRRAHRVAYELAKGPIPDGLVIDHQCFNRHCVNPDHLNAVTNQQNTLRRMGPNRNNKGTGLRNVYPTREGKYFVTLTANGKRYHGGTFTDLDEANAAAIQLRAQHNA